MSVPERRATRNAVVRSQTGKSWDEWFDILDAWNIPDLTATAERLQANYHISPWWIQAITVRYAWERGRRQ